MSEQKSKYVEQVMSLFGLRREADSGVQTVSSHSTTHSGAGAAKSIKTGATERQKDEDIFDKRLEDFISRRSPGDRLVTGRVHMINIEQVRERLGDRWPRFAERVHEVIKAELKIRLCSRDFFRRVGDDSSVIVFGDCSEAEARLKVALL